MCKACDYDLCQKCFWNAKRKESYCDGTHKIAPFGPGHRDWGLARPKRLERRKCDECSKSIATDDQRHMCKACDYDLCQECFLNAEGQEISRCEGEHKIALFGPDHRDWGLARPQRLRGRQCDECLKAIAKADPRHFCEACDYDLCQECYLNAERQKASVGGVVTATSLRKGARVKRGPDWKWGEQDGHGEGVVVGSHRDGWARVKWDRSGETDCYRVGHNGAHDLIIVPLKSQVSPVLGDSVVLSDEHQSATGPLKPGDVGKVVQDDGSGVPLLVSLAGLTGWYRRGQLRLAASGIAKAAGAVVLTTALLKEGVRVKRGPGWMWDDQDGHGEGVVVGSALSGCGWARVKWDCSGKMNNYRLGPEGAHDLLIVSPRETVTCRARHVLVPFTKSPGKGNNTCDQCDKRIPNGDPMHRCAACDYDLCPGCYRRAAAGEA